MAQRVLDTSILIDFWRTKRAHSRTPLTERLAKAWGEELARTRHSNAIVTPVYLEYLCGTQDATALQLARSFLGPFSIIDKGHILSED